MSEPKPVPTRVRYGRDGYEVEGPEEFVAATQPKLHADFAELLQKQPSAATPSAPGSAPSASSGTGGGAFEASTNTIASIIDAKTGSDLALAAIAQIQLVQKKASAQRRDILDEMKGAITFYRESFSGNLTAALDTLAKSKRINMIAKDTFSLANAERQRFERLLSEGI
jgi:hypothetical protein